MEIIFVTTSWSLLDNLQVKQIGGTGEVKCSITLNPNYAVVKLNS